MERLTGDQLVALAGTLMTERGNTARACVRTIARGEATALHACVEILRGVGQDDLAELVIDEYERLCKACVEEEVKP